MKEMAIKAGERHRILHLFSDSIPQQVRFSAALADGGAPVSGDVEVAGSRWLFGKPAVHQPLTAENVVHKGWLDTNFSIYVTPDQDTRVTLHTRHFTSRMLVWVLAAVVVLAAASAVLVPMLAG